MKTVLKVAGVLVLLLVLAVVGFALYAKNALPNVGPAPELEVERTPERIARGEYLANNVMLCVDCHSQRDWTQFSAPPVPGTWGMGGEVFGQEMGFPGHYVASNITPAGLGDWTDGEIFRAVTSGVGKDGRALFPIMPYHNYGKLDREDILSVIAYVRTLRPIENETEASSSDFPMSIIINTIPGKPEFQNKPAASDRLAYGEYMATASGCYDCHTNQDKGRFVGMPFAGGMEFPLPNGYTITAPNITPHPDALGNWTEAQFVQRFKMYADSGYVPHAVAAGERQTVMPWSMYAGMEERDLAAIFHYLQSLEAAEGNTTVEAGI